MKSRSEPSVPIAIRSVCVVLGCLTLPGALIAGGFGMMIHPVAYVGSTMLSAHCVSIAAGHCGLADVAKELIRARWG